MDWLNRFVTWPGWTAVLAVAALLTAFIFWKQLKVMAGQLDEMTRQREELRRQGEEAQNQPVTPQVYLTASGPVRAGQSTTGIRIGLHVDGQGVAFGVEVDVAKGGQTPEGLTREAPYHFASLLPGDARYVNLNWPDAEGSYLVPLEVRFENVRHRKLLVRQSVEFSGTVADARMSVPTTTPI